MMPSMMLSGEVHRTGSRYLLVSVVALDCCINASWYVHCEVSQGVDDEQRSNIKHRKEVPPALEVSLSVLFCVKRGYSMGLFDAIKKFLSDGKDELDTSTLFWEQVESGEVDYDPETMCALCGNPLCQVCSGCLRPKCSSHCTCAAEE